MITPLVSVVLPCYYSAKTLQHCLEQLRKQSFQNFEIIAVNSSQEEDTARVAAHFPEVIFIQSPQRLYPHAARNLGVTRASGRLLVFSDPDCAAEPDWLWHLVERWQEGHLVTGGAMALRQTTWLQTGIHLCKFHWCLPGDSAGPRWILATANAAYDRELWDRMGCFPNVFCGDAVQSWRARDAGAQPWFDARAIVSHTHDQTFSQFLRQRFCRGKEFAAVRVSYEAWPPQRLAATILGAPILGSWVAIRAGIDAARCGWLGSFLATLPLQILGHAAWSLGEARECCEAFGRVTPEVTAASE